MTDEDYERLQKWNEKYEKMVQFKRDYFGKKDKTDKLEAVGEMLTLVDPLIGDLGDLDDYMATLEKLAGVAGCTEVTKGIRISLRNAFGAACGLSDGLLETKGKLYDEKQLLEEDLDD